MKNYNIKNVRGQFIDQNTGKVIYPRRGGVFMLAGDDDMFVEHHQLLPDREAKSIEDHKALVVKKSKNGDLIKIADRGQKFIFRVGLSSRTPDEDDREYLFETVLLEELYMVYKPLNKSKKYELSRCLCQLTRCMYGNLIVTETVTAYSLSQLFSHVVMLYFPLQRSGAINAFSHFFYAAHEDHRIYDVKEKRLISIDKVRDLIDDEFRRENNNLMSIENLVTERVPKRMDPRPTLI
jgi:hypothetical protein